MGCAVSQLYFDVATFFVRDANTEAHWTVNRGGGAVGCGGDVVDSDALELCVSVHVDKVPAVPA